MAEHDHFSPPNKIFSLNKVKNYNSVFVGTVGRLKKLVVTNAPIVGQARLYTSVRADLNLKTLSSIEISNLTLQK